MQKTKFDEFHYDGQRRGKLLQAALAFAAKLKNIPTVGEVVEA